MSITPTAKRRIALLLSLVVLLTAGIAGLYAYRQVQQRQAAQAHRAAGMTAFDHGQFIDAVAHLGAYLKIESDDAEARYRFAQASLKVPDLTARHVHQAMRALRELLDRHPDHLDAAHELLDLYTLTHDDNRALTLANELLAGNPQDLPALRARTAALARIGQHAEALEAAEAVLALDELDWQIQLAAVELRHQLGRPDAELIADAQKLQAAHPDDPRFELVLAYAHGLAHHGEETRQWLRAAADRPAPESTFALRLIHHLDAADLFPEALAMLQREAAGRADHLLYPELVRRLFEAGRFQETLDQLGPFEPDAAHPKIELWAIRAMALTELHRDADAQAVVEAMASRPADPLAAAWVAVARAAYLTPERQPGEVIRAVEAALETYPRNAFFHALLGDAYAAVGEPELALPAWQRAAELRPSWFVPRIRRAQTLLGLGEVKQALAEVRAGLVRQPHNVTAALTWAQAQAADLQPGQPQQAEELLAFVNELIAAVPAQPEPRLLKIALLAHLGQRDAADDAARAVLASDPPLDEEALLQLAATSRRYDLGLEGAAHQRIAELYGQTPRLALDQALERAAADQPDAGLALIDAATQAAGDDPQVQRQWRLVRARYLETIADPRAEQAWITLADDAPEDARIQQLALDAAATQSNRAFRSRAIDRLRQHLGEQSLVWRVERARWLLTGPEPQRDPATASDLLRHVIARAPDRLEPRLLLAQAQEQLGLLPLAIRELRAAIPSGSAASSRIALELARLHQALRQFRSARDELQRVIDNPAAAPAELRRAAAMLARQGDDRLALDVLERLDQAGQLQEADDRLRLARLYRRSGQFDRAETVARSLIDDPSSPAKTPAAAAIAFLADLYAEQGQPDAAAQTLALIDRLDLPPGGQAVLRADYLARHGQSEEALAAYRTAAEAAGDNPVLWRRLVGYLVALGRADDALTAAEQARRVLPDDAGLQTFAQYADTVRRFAPSPLARPLVVALLEDAEHRAAAAEALRTLAEHDTDHGATVAAARGLQSLADQHPDFLALQNLLARVYLEAGRPAEAGAVALRAMDTFPTAVEPAWLAAQSLAASGRWSEALLAATQWRDRAGAQPLAADLMIARARLQLGDIANAIALLEPYLDRARAHPDEHVELVVGYTRALLAARRYADAADLLAPLLSRSEGWRRIWMELAVSAVADPRVAGQWLERVAAFMPETEVHERLLLARSWWLLSTKHRSPAYRATAAAQLQHLLDRPDTPGAPDIPAEAWYLRAVMDEQAGDKPAARASYRKALALNPDLHAARNNLAMLLLDEPAALDEAMQLAQAAVAAAPAPGSAAYLDTLAQVQAAAGQCESAVETMEAAIRLDPDNPQWRANLARILAGCGQPDRARAAASPSPFKRDALP